MEEEDSLSSASIFLRWNRRFFRFFFSLFSKSSSGVVGTSGVDSFFWQILSSTFTLGNRASLGSLPVISCFRDFFFFNCFFGTSGFFVCASSGIEFIELELNILSRAMPVVRSFFLNSSTKMSESFSPPDGKIKENRDSSDSERLTLLTRFTLTVEAKHLFSKNSLVLQKNLCKISF